MSPQEIVEKMLGRDAFSEWLGIEVLSVEHNKCKLKFTIRENMLNGFGIAHGGISFSMADSALAFASNSGGHKAVSIETSISHLKPIHAGDVIIAEAICENESKKLAHYAVKLYREKTELMVALFRGVVFKTDEKW